MNQCLICRGKVEPFMSLGQMPIANNFLLPEQFNEEYFYELRVGFCVQCAMVQLLNLVDRERMFHDHYAFFSSTSRRMAAHFDELARLVMDQHLGLEDPLVVEIGSNDGIFLRHFAAAGFRHLGVEPSANVARVAEETGVRTVCRFFDQEFAEEVLSTDGPADVIVAANVMCHIPYLHSVVSGIKHLLKPGGVLIFEDPYLGDVLDKTAYDQIYDEHTFYFSVTSLEQLFQMHDLEIVDLTLVPVHGGSMRYTVAHAGAREPSPAVDRQRQLERDKGLQSLSTYAAFQSRVEGSRDALVGLLGDLRAKGRRVVGYGATSKSTTIINFCGITPELVEFISDTTPIKQGKFSPGAHIPVKPYEAFLKRYPDYALLFAWNHAEEILANEQAFLADGGRWIVYVPEVSIRP